MFEVGFTEILVISVLALVVLGPEKLPRVAAQIGRWVGRARAMARQFREQLEEEVSLAETNKTKAKESARAEQDEAAAQSATAPSSTSGTDSPPDPNAPYGSNTQHMYSGVTGEESHSAAPMPSDMGASQPGTSTTSTTDASAANTAAETAHSDNNGPPPEPE